MLRQLRGKAGGIAAKAIIVLLILALGLWGIGDIFRGGASGNAVATLDGDSISMQELEMTLRRLQGQIPELTDEVAQSLPVRMDTLNRLLNTRLIYRHAEDLGLHVSDDVIAQAVATDPNFLDQEGNFDAEAFTLILKRNGLNQQRFTEQYRRDIQLALVDDTIRKATQVAPVMADVYHKVWAQKRKAGILLVKDKDVRTKITEPEEAALEIMYQNQQEQFRVAESRELLWYSFDAQTLKRQLNIEVSEDELRNRYDEQRDLYVQAELRDIEQFTFDDEASAKAGYEALQAEEQLKGATNLGETTYEALPEAAADEIWSLKPGEVSAPVQSEFGWQVYRVKSITPQQTLPFGDVRSELETAAMTELMEEQLNQISELLDDQIGQGATMAEALDTAGLNAKGIQTLKLSRNALPPEGVKNEVAITGFEQDEGEVSPVLLTSDNHYYLVKTHAVSPSYVKPFDQVRDLLLQNWRNDQKRSLLRTYAQNTANDLKEAEDVIGAMQETGFDLVMSGALQRESESIGKLRVTGGLMKEIFRLAQYGISDAYPLPGGEYAVAVVTEIIDASDNPAAQAQLNTTLLLSQQNEMFEAYITALREKYNVEVNIDRLMADAQGG